MSRTFSGIGPRKKDLVTSHNIPRKPSVWSRRRNNAGASLHPLKAYSIIFLVLCIYLHERNSHQCLCRAYLLCITSINSHLIMLADSSVGQLSISPKWITWTSSIQYGRAWSISHPLLRQKKLAIKKIKLLSIGFHWFPLVFSTAITPRATAPVFWRLPDGQLGLQPHAVALSLFFSLSLPHFTIKVNFNQPQGLSAAAVSLSCARCSIPLGLNAAAYRITLLFIKHPVAHYSPYSSWSH